MLYSSEEALKQKKGFHMKRSLLYLMTAFFLVVPSWALSLDVGDTAPVFQAPSTLGLIDLKDYAGKKNVVLALYYADFTPV